MAAGIWTTDALDDVFYARITARLSDLEDLEAKERAGTISEESAKRSERRAQTALKELVSLARELGCGNAAELGSEGYSTYFGVQL